MNVQIIQKDTFEIIKSTINKAVDLIKPTFGPAGNKVIIGKQLNRITVDDGVQIARDLEFSDPAENAVWLEAKGTAIKTNDRVGDGTTGALIMLQAIINEVSKSSRWEGRKVENELKKGLEEATSQLLKMSVPVKTLSDLEKVARISFDDESISKIIAETWYKLGQDGVVTVGRSGTMETFAELTEGIKINRGYISPYMVTNPARMEGVIEKPYILLTDYRLTETNDILPIMTALATKNISNLVLICDNIENSALGTAIVNKLQGKFNLIAINAPFQGPERTNFFEDIALLTGAKFFSQDKGDKLESAVIEDLGRAERFVSKRESSVIIGAKGDKKAIKQAITDLENSIANTVEEHVKNSLKERLARVSKKVAVIKVGAPTEPEEKALQFKIDDAIHAVYSAFKGGVVPGAGLALASIETSSPILNNALQEPFKQLKENVGLESHRPLERGQAINVVTGNIGKFIEVGVMDPVDVIIAGIESAVSIASLLLTSKGMIVEIPKEPKQE